MRLAALCLMLVVAAADASARETVDASAPSAISVTVYRDPERAPGQKLDRDWPRGFAMISETRSVTLPAGESTVRFDGVAEGMVAVSAIVTGLPGGAIEKNRNADLLSPGALVDGTLGNRVTISRTNPATGAETREEAIVRSRADGGLVLQTATGFEAVRCSGLPEKLVFQRVPEGLSPDPVYSIDTRSPEGGTYTVTLTYLAWGFDWQANHVATLGGDASGGEVDLHLTSWLTLVNDNGQSFPGAELMAVAGRLKVVSDYRALADPPDARPLELVCYPLGSTAAGSPEPYPDSAYPFPAPPPPPPVAMEAAQAITVTGSRGSAPALMARQEDLADLKLYRVPEPITVAAKSQKQIAFLDREGVKGRLLYRGECTPWSHDDGNSAQPAEVMLATVNDESHGLGVALPMGAVAVFEESPRGDVLVGQEIVRDYAAGQDVEIALGRSAQVFVTCTTLDPEFSEDPGERVRMRATLSNANAAPVTVRLSIGPAGEGTIEGMRRVRTKDGQRVIEAIIPANSRREIAWSHVFQRVAAYN
ncbi:hypothetical protein GCM10011515_14860 [Tsuneonella deserti]|uniref:DUF4139 domain-containing protein n=1 Tax=Tsuneonella deserti TaxID=2035528 RepID=A0ABQ1S634_9SPHN|nr:hypothetical protein [Tsuneonella deserti]GGD95956.1 hypothetical protein GCM10011515_14860 [Tsuneonella deserti]